jgi:hypothetical protein
MKTMRRSDCLEAKSIRVVACDFCPAVHIDFLDGHGECFATASVPREHFDPFIAQFRDAVTELDRRPRIYQ